VGLDITHHGEEAYVHTGGASPTRPMARESMAPQSALEPIKGDA
jgi:hypothetical protein